MNLALHLANTVIRRGPDTVDLIADEPALLAWLDEAGGPKDVDRAALRRLRTAVREALESVVDGRRVPDAVVAHLNRTSAAGPSYPQLDGGELGYVMLASPDEAFLVDVAADAIRLVGGPQRPLLRRCRARGCDRVFVASRPQQTWCSDTCGVRARVARHRAAA